MEPLYRIGIRLIELKIQIGAKNTYLVTYIYLVLDVVFNVWVIYNN